jgi:hypothetical protein
MSNKGFFEGIKQNSSIESVKLFMCSLSAGAGRSFLNAFGTNSVLDTLTITVCDFGAEGVQNLVAMIKRCALL